MQGIPEQVPAQVGAAFCEGTEITGDQRRVLHPASCCEPLLHMLPSQWVPHSFLQTVSTEQNREQPAASVPRFRPGPSDLYPERRDARLTFPCLLLVAL
jgi:hypothetical protein